jgi:hypothetical protein
LPCRLPNIAHSCACVLHPRCRMNQFFSPGFPCLATWFFAPARQGAPSSPYGHMTTCRIDYFVLFSQNLTHFPTKVKWGPTTALAAQESGIRHIYGLCCYNTHARVAPSCWQMKAEGIRPSPRICTLSTKLFP